MNRSPIEPRSRPADPAAEPLDPGVASRFRDFLATRGLRMTRERVAILEAALAVRDHFDVETLYVDLCRRSSQVSRATIYRTLDLLVQSGLVDRERFGTDSFSYEPIHGREHHDHMVCNSCGQVIEFCSGEIERQQDLACEEHGFVPESHRLTIFGRCSRCAEEEHAAQGEIRRHG